tara:strand:+ start:1010 stop:1393 length:384 start_codon:yes stop_codon:yes gene_type:complete
MTIITYPFLLPNYYTKTFDGKMTFPGVPYIKSYYQYIDLNEDKKLQKNVTKFFYDELINKWIQNDKIFNKFKSQKILKTKDGLQLIYKILLKLVTKGDTKWWDLKEPQYILTKDYIFYQLSKFFRNT